MPEDELLPPAIYDDLVAESRAAGTAVPDGHYGDDPAMAWLPELLEYAAPSPTVFEHPDGSRYERIPPDDLAA